MKRLMTLALAVAISLVTYAQDYNFAVGLRGATEYGLTVKSMMDRNHGAELIVGSRWMGFNITGLYEYHAELQARGMNIYFGGGAHMGSWRDRGEEPSNDTHSGIRSVVGVDVIVGLEYNFRDVPLNISLDYKPMYNLTGYEGLDADGVGFSLRLAF